MNRWQTDPDPDGRASDHALRRPGGRQRPVLHRRPRRHHRPDRPERRRQDHRLQLHHRLLQADRGPHRAGPAARRVSTASPRRPSTARGPADGRGLFLLERMPDYEIAKHARVARTFQNIRLFGGMTVLENLMVAQHNKLMVASGYSIAGILGLPSYRAGHQAAIDKATYWLEQVDLLDRADDPAGDLPYGAQRRLEIARAMCTDPLLLCLDEPAAGLNPRESRRTQRAAPLHPRQARHLRPAHRARHGRRHGDFRPHRRARLRREDLRRLRRFRPQRPQGHRRLSRRRGRGSRTGRGGGAAHERAPALASAA